MEFFHIVGFQELCLWKNTSQWCKENIFLPLYNFDTKKDIYIPGKALPSPPWKTYKVSVATAYQYWVRAVGWSSCLQGPLLQWWRLLRRAWWQEWPPNWLCWYQNWNACIFTLRICQNLVNIEQGGLDVDNYFTVNFYDGWWKCRMYCAIWLGCANHPKKNGKKEKLFTCKPIKSGPACIFLYLKKNVIIFLN